MFSWDEFNRRIATRREVQFQKEKMLDIIRELLLGKEYDKAIQILSVLWRRHYEYPVFCIRVCFLLFIYYNNN